MIDPNRDKLRELYHIDAKYCNIDALVDKILDGSPADFGCEVYRSKEGTYYAVIMSKDPLPDDDKIISSLDNYEQQNEYDIYARYIPLEPIRPVKGLRVYRLAPHFRDGAYQPISIIYNLR